LEKEKERRRYKRFKYETLMSHDVSINNIVHPGKMYNFSKGGLYFESDQKIYPGEDIYVALGIHADSPGKDTQLLFEVKIIWHQELQDSSFSYGYGGKFLNSPDAIIETGKIRETEKKHAIIEEFGGDNDSRKYRRRPYNKTLKFSYRNSEREGFVANISPGGAFILTKDKFDLGGRLKLVIPAWKTTKEIKVIGWIVRLSKDGIGVSFERRSGRERRSDLDRRTGMERRGRKRKKPDRKV
jgi:Tfp pilus assembly protein PilZ